MENIGFVLMILNFCIWIGVGIYLLGLITRLVRAHERVAQALEDTARNTPRRDL